MSSLRLALKASLEQPNGSADKDRQPRDKEKKPRKERSGSEGAAPPSHAKSAVKAPRAPASPVSASKPSSQVPRRPPKHPGSTQVRSPQKEQKGVHQHGSEKPLKREALPDGASKDVDQPAPGKKRRRTESDLSEKPGSSAGTPRADAGARQTQDARPKPAIGDAATPVAASFAKPSTPRAQSAESPAAPTPSSSSASSHVATAPGRAEAGASQSVSANRPDAAAPSGLRIAIPEAQSDDTESLSPTSQFRSEQDEQGSHLLSSGLDEHAGISSDREDNEGLLVSREDSVHEDDGEGEEEHEEDEHEHDERDDEEEEEDEDEHEHEHDEEEDDDETETDEETSRSARRRSKSESRTPSASSRGKQSRGNKTDSVRRQKRTLDEATGKPRPSRSAAVVANTKLTGRTPRSGSDVGLTESRRARSDETKRATATPAVKEENWVQCDKCGKWRRIPGSVDMDSLPDSWFCSMNQWDELRNSCEAAEEAYQDTMVDLTPRRAADAEDEEPSRGTRGRPSMRGQKKRRANRGRDSDDDTDSVYDQKATRETKRRAVQTPRGSADGGLVGVGVAAVVEKVDWVQCNKCRKWRKVPSSIDVSQFPADWYCSMNTWAPRMATCEAPEEDEDPQLVSLPMRGQRSRRPRQDTLDGEPKKEVRHWVQCERRGCKKWRRLPLGMTPEELPDKWYCEMNTWDPDLATCDAPEEMETREEAAGLGPSVISLRAKNAGMLSYRKLIFGPDGRVRPIFSDRNRNNFGLFSFVETHRQTGSDDYIEPTRRVGYWWASCYDNSSAVTGASPVAANTRTQRGRRRGRRGARGARQAKPKQEEESEEEEDEEEKDGEKDDDNEDTKAGRQEENNADAEGKQSAVKMEVHEMAEPVVKMETHDASAPQRESSDSTTHAATESADDEDADAGEKSKEKKCSKKDGAEKSKRTSGAATDKALTSKAENKENKENKESKDNCDEAIASKEDTFGLNSYSADLVRTAQRAAGWSLAPATRAQKHACTQASMPLLHRRNIERGIVRTLINFAGCDGKTEAEFFADLQRIMFARPEVEACKRMLTVATIRSYVRELELEGLAEVLYNNMGSLVFKKLKAPVCDELGFDKGKQAEECRGPLKLRKPWVAVKQQQQQQQQQQAA